MDGVQEGETIHIFRRARLFYFSVQTQSMVCYGVLGTT